METTAGRQAFDRSSGVNSGKPGAWLPFDEYQPNFGFNKEQYRIGELSPYGTEELKAISEALVRCALRPPKCWKRA